MWVFSGVAGGGGVGGVFFSGCGYRSGVGFFISRLGVDAG